jgi:hypothetical protein
MDGNGRGWCGKAPHTEQAFFLGGPQGLACSPLFFSVALSPE